MFANANSAAWDMAKQIQKMEQEKALKIQQAKLRQQHLKQQGASSQQLQRPPQAPASAKTKSRRGFFGFGSKKNVTAGPGSAKNVSAAPLEDASSHTGGDPTVFTEDETTNREEETSFRSQQDASKTGVLKWNKPVQAISSAVKKSSLKAVDESGDPDYKQNNKNSIRRENRAVDEEPEPSSSKVHTEKIIEESKEQEEKPPFFVDEVVASASDEVTCLTMDDFDRTVPTTSKPTKVKRTSKSQRSLSSATTDSGIADILRKDIHSKKQPVLLAALEAVKEYASKGSKQRSKVCAFGAIPAILKIIDGKKTTHKVLLAALAALEQVAISDVHNQTTACELDAISTISFCMQRHFLVKEIVLAACKTLEVVTSFLRLESPDDVDSFQEMNTEGAMTVLSCCLMTHPKDKDISMHAIGAISNICMYRPDELVKLSESGGIVAMTAALQRKWKSKERKKHAQVDLAIIVASIEQSSSEDEEEDDESSESSSSDEEEGSDE